MSVYLRGRNGTRFLHETILLSSKKDDSLRDVKQLPRSTIGVAIFLKGCTFLFSAIVVLAIIFKQSKYDVCSWAKRRSCVFTFIYVDVIIVLGKSDIKRMLSKEFEMKVTSWVSLFIVPERKDHYS